MSKKYHTQLYLKNKDEYSKYLKDLIKNGIKLQDENGEINPIIFDFRFIISDGEREYLFPSDTEFP